MPVDCSECHDLALVDQEHAVGDQKWAGEFVHNDDDDHEGPSPEVLPSVLFSTERKRILTTRRKSRSSLYVPVMAKV